MAMNSVNTNMSSMLALQSLNRTSDQLSVVQKRVSTGFRVADSKDDGGAFAVAQAVRADVAGLAAANEQLGGTKGILETTFAALGKVSETMVKVRETLTRLADGTLNDEQRSQYETQYSALKTQIENFITDATYNGRSLLNTEATAGGGNIEMTRNEAGGVFTISAVDGATDLVIAAAPTDAAEAQTALQDGGDFETVESKIANALNTFVRV